jgi:hypothetical protein
MQIVSGNIDEFQLYPEVSRVPHLIP